MTPMPAIVFVESHTGSATTFSLLSIKLDLRGRTDLPDAVTAIKVSGTAASRELSLDTPGASLNLVASSGSGQPASSSGTQVLGCATSGSGELASSAARFVDSVGVNTHITYTDTEYGNSALLIDKLQRLKVKHIRDGLGAAASPVAQTLGLAGIGLVLNVGKPPYSSSTMAKAVATNTIGGSKFIEAWEGENEQDVNDRTWVTNWNPAFAALKAANTTGTPVWGPPLAFANNAAKLTPVQAAYGTFHPYPGGQNPSVLFPSQTALIQPLFPGESLIATESGYHNALADTADQPAIDYATGAKYFPRLLLESFNAGLFRTYIYELFDEVSTWNKALQDTADSNEQCHWGLVDANGVEKPGFTAIQNLLTILSSGDVETGSPTSLSYTLSGGANLHHLLVQKSYNVFDLVLWQNVSSWNQKTQKEIQNAPLNVTLTVNGATVTTYQPSVSAIGTPQTMTGNSVVLKVPDEAFIAEITLPTTASCTAH